MMGGMNKRKGPGFFWSLVIADLVYQQSGLDHSIAPAGLLDIFAFTRRTWI
jgi:hypothetical protein